MTREVDLNRLTRKQRFKLGETDSEGRPSSTDDVAEELVAEEYGLIHVPDESEWYDCRLASTGAKTEVKSTAVSIGEEYPAAGRFRIRDDQTRSLLASDASGVAWYAFVLFDFEHGVARIRRAKPKTVSRLIRERGGWNRANHAEFSKQHKLPYSVIF